MRIGQADKRSTSIFVFSLDSGAISMEYQEATNRHTFEQKGRIQGRGGGLMSNCMGVPIKDPTPLFCDNMRNIYLAWNPVFQAHTKHIEVHYHFIRECVLVGDVDLQHISTNL